jgi:hypothetical protein
VLANEWRVKRLDLYGCPRGYCVSIVIEPQIYIGELGNYLAREFGVVVTYSSLGAPLLYGSICLIVGLAWFRRINL